MSALIRVAVPVPLAEAFDYLWPVGQPLPPAGSRVRVPFGRGERIAVVVDHPPSSDLPQSKLKVAHELLDAAPVVDAELLATLRWAADYYHYPLGEVLSHALPARLRKGGSVETRKRAADPQPAQEPTDEPRPLTTDQQAVLDAIRADGAAGFRAWLLHGVTGSGKTEIYMRLTAATLAAGRQTLLLVPEIGLTPQLVARLRARFGTALAVMHSGLADGERLAAWRDSRDGRAQLIVGTRSAVFAPLPNAGLIVVDEEHDASYKQQSGFLYSARDLAVVRAQKLGVPIVLGSATPSLESWRNAGQGRYRKLALPRRIGTAGKPAMRVLDLNRHASRQGLSTPLLSAVQRHLEAGSQVLLFLNRRGFAPALFCPTCALPESCRRCDARLTVHARAGVLRCHHCGHERPLSWRCPTCGTERLAVGAGTQRVGDELAAQFPAARIARLDRDATARKGALAAVLDDVEAGRTDILIGTQMLTKGHDFPRVTLVGVLNADQGLFGTDPRSHERFAQTLLQVAGRAGRAELPGEVLIQTHYPGHPLLASLLAQDYAAFAALALAEREAAGWPPFRHLAVWRAEAPKREAVFAFLERAKEASRRAAVRHAAGTVTLLGPAPAAMERKEGRFRAQLLAQAGDRRALHDVLTAALATVRAAPESRKVRFSLDVDPLEL